MIRTLALAVGTAAAVAAPAAHASPASRCLTVSPAVVRAISAGLTVNGGGKLRAVRAVRSHDYKRLFFVSADIQGAGMNGRDEIATWATNQIAAYGMIYAVGGFANEFSDWGDGGRTDAHMSVTDDGADASRVCSRAALRST